MPKISNNNGVVITNKSLVSAFQRLYDTISYISFNCLFFFGRYSFNCQEQTILDNLSRPFRKKEEDNLSNKLNVPKFFSFFFFFLAKSSFTPRGKSL